MQIMLHPSYILHYRSYRETSLLLDVFTQEYGLISLVARGVKGAKRSTLKALLQPFNSLLLSWKGKSELMSLTEAEPLSVLFQLTGSGLISGFYLNEILLRLLHKHDPHPQLYTTYHQTLIELNAPILQQKSLRLFEKKLLEELGYGLQLDQDILSGQPFVADKMYRFLPELGFELCKDESNIYSPTHFSGKSLIALAKEELDDLECQQEIKRLMRLVLTPLLGPKPLQSRRLFA